jgi:hypothetical protein
LEGFFLFIMKLIYFLRIWDWYWWYKMC